jgi:hypothetical protein
MTGRERWRAVLARQKPDRIPMNIWATEETFRLLQDHLGRDKDALLDRLHIDMPLAVAGRYVGPPLPPNQDAYGLIYRDIEYGTGAYHEPVNTPLARFNTVDEIEAGCRWPSPDWWDYSWLPAEMKGQEHRIVRGGYSNGKLPRRDSATNSFFTERWTINKHCHSEAPKTSKTKSCRTFESLPAAATSLPLVTISNPSRPWRISWHCTKPAMSLGGNDD